MCKSYSSWLCLIQHANPWNSVGYPGRMCAQAGCTFTVSIITKREKSMPQASVCQCRRLAVVSESRSACCPKFHQKKKREMLEV